MLDQDISTADARRLLSVGPRQLAHGLPDVIGPGGWTRRGFLQAVGLGVGGGALTGALGDGFLPGEWDDVRGAFASPPIGPTDGILVTIMLYGGNDGLNTVVPYTDGAYYQQRSNIAVPANQVLPINGQVGLNPQLPYLHSMYQRGQMAIVQGVGYPNPDLSHFTSMAIWMNARFGPGAPTTGWIGRWLDGLGARPGRARRGDHRCVGRPAPRGRAAACGRHLPVGRHVRRRQPTAGPADVRGHQGHGQPGIGPRPVARHVRGHDAHPARPRPRRGPGVRADAARGRPLEEADDRRPPRQREHRPARDRRRPRRLRQPRRPARQPPRSARRDRHGDRDVLRDAVARLSATG